MTIRKKRSLHSIAFVKALTKSKSKSPYTKITNIVKREEGIEVVVQEEQKRYRVSIGEDVFCTCTPSQRADRKICNHVIWVYMNLLKFTEDDVTIGQIHTDTPTLMKLLNICPLSIPDNLSA